MDYEKLLTIKQVAEYLQVPENTVRVWLKRKKMKGVKLGVLWRIREKDLEDFIRVVE